MTINYKVLPRGGVTGVIQVPGDKSISHRSVMLGALAEGITHIKGFLESEDALATLNAFRLMGVAIEELDSGCLTIDGVGLNGLKSPDNALYLGNAGTAMRLMAGLMAAQPFDTTLTGDSSLSGRPMGRIIKPLVQMGAEISSPDSDCPPLYISGGKLLKGIDYHLPMASAQVKSCLLLAGLYASGKTTVTEPEVTRDHTERMLQSFGYDVQVKGSGVSLIGGGKLKGTTIEIPADISSAAFFMVAASIAEGSDITLTSVGVNPTRDGVVQILRLMGANITLMNERMLGVEPVADIRVRYAPLTGINIPESLVPLAIDEFPALFVAAACAKGVTRLTGAKELKVKESDRIKVMAEGLTRLGIRATSTSDGMDIVGGSISGGEVFSYHDHRIAMSFAIAGFKGIFFCFNKGLRQCFNFFSGI